MTYDTLDDVDVSGHHVEGNTAEYCALDHHDTELDCWAESNRDYIIAALRKVDATGAHWAETYGDIAVTITDDSGAVTPAYVRYAELIRELSDTPILDELDASQRVWNAAEDDIDDYTDEAERMLAYTGDGDATADTPLEYCSVDLDDYRTTPAIDGIRELAHYIAVETIRGN